MQVDNITAAILERQKIIRMIGYIHRDLGMLFERQKYICGHVFKADASGSEEIIKHWLEDSKLNHSDNILRLRDYVLGTSGQAEISLDKDFKYFLYHMTCAQMSFNMAVYRCLNYVTSLGGTDERAITYSEDNAVRFLPNKLQGLYGEVESGVEDKARDWISRRHLLGTLMTEFSLGITSMFYTFKDRLLSVTGKSEKSFRHVSNTFQFFEESLGRNHQEIDELITEHGKFLKTNADLKTEIIAMTTLTLFSKIVKINESSLNIVMSAYEKLQPQTMVLDQ